MYSSLAICALLTMQLQTVLGGISYFCYNCAQCTGSDTINAEVLSQVNLDSSKTLTAQVTDTTTLATLESDLGIDCMNYDTEGDPWLSACASVQYAVKSSDNEIVATCRMLVSYQTLFTDHLDTAADYPIDTSLNAATVTGGGSIVGVSYDSCGNNFCNGDLGPTETLMFSIKAGDWMWQYSDKMSTESQEIEDNFQVIAAEMHELIWAEEHISADYPSSIEMYQIRQSGDYAYFDINVMLITGSLNSTELMNIYTSARQTALDENPSDASTIEAFEETMMEYDDLTPEAPTDSASVKIAAVHLIAMTVLPVVMH